MSYDLGLHDPVSGEAIVFDEPHQMRGGTYAIGGTCSASLNITYNYWAHFRRALGDERGIRAIYGLSGAESIPVLKRGIAALGDDVSADYWEPTEGNAKRALAQCLALAQMRPDGVWDGD